MSLWDARTLTLLGTVQPGDTTVTPLFLDDHTLQLQYDDGASYEWDTSEAYARSTACRIVGQGPSRAQWQAWFGDREYVDVCP